MSSTLITNIGELVTNDPERADLLGVVEDAALVVEGAPVAWVGPRRRRARPPTSGSTSAAAR